MIPAVEMLMTTRGAEKSLLQAAQKDPGARRAKNRRAETYLQYVEARRLSGNEAYGFFTAA
jgi:hypothetical protein